MGEQMDIMAYLEGGGRLTSPANAPPRYRAELMRMMASFVDSELAGAAGFADVINAAPGVAERIAAAKIVLEKNDHAGRVLRLMGEFGADAARYATHHPWTDRLARDAEIGARRASPDMRLAVFNYPLAGWTDAVTMNLLMGTAVGVQLSDFARVSYQPLADAFTEIAPREARHAELAAEGLARLLADGGKAAITQSIAYWWPRVETSFGADDSPRQPLLARLGLRHADNATQRRAWQDNAAAALDALGLKRP